MVIRFTPNGFFVSSFVPAISRSSSSGVIAPQAITTSEIKVSVLIEEDYTELAVRVLHTAYGLDADEAAA
jgi:aspartokinase